MSNFKNWILKNKTLDTIIIGYFLATSISAFYKKAFDSFFTPILDKLVPGDNNFELEVLGVKLKIHEFVLAFVQLLFSLVLAYYLKKIMNSIK
mgnify:CR=1 FL=1